MKIGVVIVTYNRLEKLKKALNAYELQSKTPEYILVVDNASTDGTKEYLDLWKTEKRNTNKYVYTMEENLGGSAGFAFGLNEALNLEADWIWIADDDAYTQENAFELSEKIICKSDETIAALCASVITDDKIILSHRRHLKRGLINVSDYQSTIQEYDNEMFEIDLLSYVGSLISKKAILEVGVTKKDYFIWFDDTEHSMRLRKYGKIYCVPEIKVIHDTIIPPDNEQIKLNWKWYYGKRNEIDAYKCNMTKMQYYGLLVKYYYYLVKLFLNPNEKDRYYALRQAISDGKRGKLGKHSVYLPGWAPNEK